MLMFNIREVQQIKKIDNNTELIIIKEYSKGLSCRKIGKLLGISETTVFAVLKRNNIELRTKGGIKKLNIEDIKNDYINNHMTLNSIAKKHNVSLETIRRYLLKEGVHLRSISEHYNPNLKHDFFNKIDNEYKAYFLGFLITDGNISSPDNKNNKPTKSVRLSLNSVDKYIIEEFKTQLNLSENKNIIDDNRGCSTLTIYSNPMCEDLEKYGVVCNKTWKTYLPKLDEYMMPHLIRGLIDGDGWITKFKTSKNKKGYGLGFCGNKELVLELRDYLCDKLDIYRVKETIKDKLYSVKWGSKNDILKICEYIYSDSNVYLTRKYDTYKQILNE